MHKPSVAKTPTVKTASIMLPLHTESGLPPEYCCFYPRPRNFQVCRSSSAWSSVRRSAHTGGTTSAVRSSVKQSPTFWTANSNRPASVRISASRSLCSCAVGFKDHPQWDDRIVESRRANQRRRSIPACNFRNTSGRCPEATNNAFSSRGLSVQIICLVSAVLSSHVRDSAIVIFVVKIRRKVLGFPARS